MGDDIITKFNNKLNSFSVGKKIILLCCMLAILYGIFLMTTIDRIERFDYFEYDTIVCSETYINGVLNCTPCPQNTIYYPQLQPWEEFIQNYENGTLIPNQS